VGHGLASKKLGRSPSSINTPFSRTSPPLLVVRWFARATWQLYFDPPDCEIVRSTAPSVLVPPFFFCGEKLFSISSIPQSRLLYFFTPGLEWADASPRPCFSNPLLLLPYFPTSFFVHFRGPWPDTDLIQHRVAARIAGW